MISAELEDVGRDGIVDQIEGQLSSDNNPKNNKPKLDFGYWKNRTREETREIAENIVDQIQQILPVGIDVSVEQKGVYQIITFRREDDANVRMCAINEYLRNIGVARGADEFYPINGDKTELRFTSRVPHSEVERLESKILEQFEPYADERGLGEPMTDTNVGRNEGWYHIEMLDYCAEFGEDCLYDMVDEHLYQEGSCEFVEENLTEDFYAMVYSICYTPEQ